MFQPKTAAINYQTYHILCSRLLTNLMGSADNNHSEASWVCPAFSYMPEIIYIRLQIESHEIRLQHPFSSL